MRCGGLRLRWTLDDWRGWGLALHSLARCFLRRGAIDRRTHFLRRTLGLYYAAHRLLDGPRDLRGALGRGRDLAALDLWLPLRDLLRRGIGALGIHRADACRGFGLRFHAHGCIEFWPLGGRGRFGPFAHDGCGRCFAARW